jgi:hypothetical protein
MCKSFKSLFCPVFVNRVGIRSVEFSSRARGLRHAAGSRVMKGATLHWTGLVLKEPKRISEEYVVNSCSCEEGRDPSTPNELAARSRSALRMTVERF